jgi:hypothetical protein
LLCRVPCVGGNGAIDRLGFPETCGFARSIEEVGQIAERLLTDANAYRTTVAAMIPAASKVLGFEVVAARLADFFCSRRPVGGE